MNLIEAAKAAKEKEQAAALARRRAWFDLHDGQSRRTIAETFNQFIGSSQVKPGDLVAGYQSRDGGMVPHLYEVVTGGLRFSLSMETNTGLVVRVHTKPGMGGGTGTYAEWVTIHRLSDLAGLADALAFEEPQPATHAAKV